MKLLVDKRLNIPEKIIANPNIYIMTPPVNLYQLELDFSRYKEEDEV